MHVKRKTYLTVAAVFAFMFLLLLSFIPGGKASAATKTYSVSCTGGTVSYYNSNVNYFSNDSRVSIYCSNKGSFTITVKPNTSTSSRTITLYSKKGNGTTVDTLKISQAGIATKTINVGCTGGNMYYYNANAYSYIYSNTLVCNSRSNNNFVVKPNTNSQARSCKVTVKNRAGNILAYVTINQSGVPGKTINVSSTGGNYAHGVSGVYSVSSSNTSICSGLTSDKKSLIVKPSTSTSVRRCTVTMRNSAGKVIAYVAITQSGVHVKKVSASGDSGAKFSYGNSNVANFTYSSSYVSSISASNPGSFTIYLKENPSPSKTRTFDIIAKNSKGAYVEIIRVTQAKHTVTSKTLNVPCTGGKVYYANSIASSYSYSNTSICNSRSGNYFVVNPNSSTAARTCTVTVKNSAGEVVGYVYIKQSGVPTKTINAACTGSNYTHGISGVYSATSDNTSICSGLTSDKKSLIVKPNKTTSARNCRVTLKNSSSKVIAYVYIKQAAVPVKNVSLSGGYTSFGYYKSGATSFSYTSSQVYNVTCSNPYSYTLYVTANPNASASRTFNVIAKNSSGAYLEIIKVTQAKTVYSTVTSNYNSDPRTITLSAANADYSKTVISNTSMCTKGSTSTKFNLTQNTSTNARSCTVTFKDKYGAIVKKCVIKQAGVPTKTINAACTGGEYSHNIANAYYFSSNNTAVCSTIRNGKVVVMPNSSTATRSCTLTIKNSSNEIIAYVYIKQAAVPVKTVSASGDSGAKFSYGNSNVTNFSYSSSYVSKVTASNPGSFTLYLKENPSPSKTRTFDIIAKNSKGQYVEIIRVTQSKHTVTSKTINIESTGGNVYYANAIASTYSYGNTVVCNSRSGNYFVVKPSTSTLTRSCKVTVKNSEGEVVAYVTIKQSGVPVKYVTVLGNNSAKLDYGNSKATSFKYSSTYVSKITASNSGSFKIYFYANPSETSSRTFNIIAKNSKDEYVEVIRVTQKSFTPVIITKPIVGSKRTTFIYTNPDAAKFTYSLSSMCGSCKSLGNSKYEFIISANDLSSSRRCAIFVKDKNGTVIEKISLRQEAVVTYTVGSGSGENITYSNPDAVKFDLPDNINSYQKKSTGVYVFTQKANLSKNVKEGLVSVRDKNGIIIEYLRIYSTPTIMSINGDFGEKIPKGGNTYDVVFKTSNPVTVTLTNATFSDGSTSKKINKNAVKEYGYCTSEYTIKVAAMKGDSSRQVKISVTNGSVTATKTLIQNPVLEIQDYRHDAFDFRANGDFMWNLAVGSACEDNSRQYLSIYIDANTDWKLESSSDWLYLGLASGEVNTYEAAKFRQCSTESISGGAGKHHVLIWAKGNYASSSPRNCKITFSTAGISKSYSIEQWYISMVNGEDKEKHIENVKEADWYDYLSPETEQYFFGNKVTNGIQVYQSSIDTDIYYAVDTYFDKGYATIKCDYVFIKIQYLKATNANKKVIYIETPFNCNMKVEGTESPIVYVSGPVRLADIKMDSTSETDKSLELKKFLANAAFDGGKLIVDEVLSKKYPYIEKYVEQSSGALVYVAKLKVGSYFEQEEYKDEVIMSNAHDLSVYMHKKNSILPEDEYKIDYYDDGIVNECTVNFKISSSQNSTNFKRNVLF